MRALGFRKFILHPSSFILCSVITALPAWSQSFPARPIRIVVPWPAGGPPDAVGRLLAARLADTFKQQVVIDNRPGANSVIGTEIVAKSRPTATRI